MQPIGYIVVLRMKVTAAFSYQTRLRDFLPDGLLARGQVRMLLPQVYEAEFHTRLGKAKKEGPELKRLRPSMKR